MDEFSLGRHNIYERESNSYKRLISFLTHIRYWYHSQPKTLKIIKFMSLLLLRYPTFSSLLNTRLRFTFGFLIVL